MVQKNDYVSFTAQYIVVHDDYGQLHVVPPVWMNSRMQHRVVDVKSTRDHGEFYRIKLIIQSARMAPRDDGYWVHASYTKEASFCGVRPIRGSLLSKFRQHYVSWRNSILEFEGRSLPNE